MSNRLCRAPVRADLEGQLALDFEHVTDLVEDPRELVVGQKRYVVAARRTAKRVIWRLIAGRSRPGFARRPYVDPLRPRRCRSTCRTHLSQRNGPPYDRCRAEI